ncbi:MAG: ABC transporter permease [Clostridia bacterium]|nr:ABC transporter permease [Clostridia bacterium]
MKDFNTVFMFYLKKQLQSKVFLFVTLFLCVASAFSLMGLKYSVSNAKKTTLYIVNQTSRLKNTLNNEAFQNYSLGNIKLDFTLIDSNKSIKEIISEAKQKEIPILVYREENGAIIMNLIDKGKISYFDATLLQSLTKQVYQAEKIAQSGISKELLAEINPHIEIKITNPSDDRGRFGIVLVMFILMVVFIIMYSSAASNEIAYLKTNRVMEIFITSVKPLPLYAGVNLSYCFIPLLQLCCVIFTVFITKFAANIDFEKISSTAGINLNTLQVNTIAAYILLFLLGFFVYSFINTAMVSIVSKSEDITAISVPIAFVGLSQYFLSVMAAIDDSMTTRIFSFIPLTSPSVMFVRYAFGFAGTGQLIAALSILAATAVLLAITGAHLFARGITFYGNLKDFSYKTKKK